MHIIHIFDILEGKRDLRKTRLNEYQALIKDIKETTRKVEEVKSNYNDNTAVTSQEQTFQDLMNMEVKLNSFYRIVSMLGDPTSDQQFVTVRKVSDLINSLNDFSMLNYLKL